MSTETIYVGKVFTVKGWTEDDTCRVLEYLDELAKNVDSDAPRLRYLIEKMADHGIIRNNRQVRSVSANIFEFKAPNTGRILFFYDKKHIIICTHGFSGKKGSEKKFIKRQIEISDRIRKDYFDEVGE